MTAEEMRKSSLKKKQKKTRRSSGSSPTSFSSLPYDVALNCIARVSRTHHPTLSLVSKSFRSLVASPDLKAERFRIGKNDKCLCVCLDLNNFNPNPSWYIVSSTPKHKLIPVASFPYQYPSLSAVVSIGSDIYIIGGSVVKGKRSRRVYLLDCQSRQWRRLPKLRVARKKTFADVFDGKIYVRGGCSKKYLHTEVWREVYDPKTQTWEPCSHSLKEIGFMSVSKLVRAGLACSRILYYLGLKREMYCMVLLEKNQWCKAMVTDGRLVFADLQPILPLWTRVAGLEEMSSNYLISVANSSEGGRRVTVWWKTEEFCIDTKIWCAEISLERRTCGMIWGVVEWSQNVFTFPGRKSDPYSLFGQTAIVTL